VYIILSHTPAAFYQKIPWLLGIKPVPIHAGTFVGHTTCCGKDLQDAVPNDTNLGKDLGEV